MTTIVCELCDFKCCKPIDWSRHLKTKKHNGHSKIMTKIFECNVCSFVCSKQSAYHVHMNTRKHAGRVKNNTTPLIECDELPKNDDMGQNVSEIGLADFTRPEHLGIIKQLLTQNNELKNFIIDQAQEHKRETADILNRVIEQANEHKKETFEIMNKVLDTAKPSIANTINNNNNQKFNINVFLNEQCKDAMNFSDFVKNLVVSREDLENNAQLGFVNGVSKILIDSLKQLSKTERPIHCTDVKRETMYIKDEDKWTREEDSIKINKAIQEVTRKSMISLLDWKGENPDYKDRDSEFSERCIVIQQQSMAAHNRDTYFPKVAKLVAKEVAIST